MAEGDLEKRVGKVENRVTTLETEMPYLKDSIDRNTHSTDKLNLTLDALRDTMKDIGFKTKEQDEKIAANETHINEVEKQVEVIEEKGKFDIWEFLKKNWPWFIIVAAAYGSQYIKF